MFHSHTDNSLQASKDLCPVHSVKQVLRLTPHILGDTPLLVFLVTDKPMPTSYIRGVWIAALTAVGEDPSVYSLHSLRKASATTAYAGGFSEPEFHHFGGWSSQAHRIYIRTQEQKKISDILTRSMNSCTIFITHTTHPSSDYFRVWPSSYIISPNINTIQPTNFYNFTTQQFYLILFIYYHHISLFVHLNN